MKQLSHYDPFPLSLELSLHSVPGSYHLLGNSSGHRSSPPIKVLIPGLLPCVQVACISPTPKDEILITSQAGCESSCTKTPSYCLLSWTTLKSTVSYWVFQKTDSKRELRLLKPYWRWSKPPKEQEGSRVGQGFPSAHDADLTNSLSAQQGVAEQG